MLGPVNFYARFFKNRSAKLKPLYDLLNKEKEKCDDECESAFTWVKNELISPNFLAHYDPNEDSKQILLACDASDYGLSVFCLIFIKTDQKDQSRTRQRKYPRRN